MTDLADRTVLVTGGNRGVGRGIALACAADGANVVVASRRVTGGEAVVEEVAARGGTALAVACDVVDRASVDAAVAAAVERFGGLHAVVHNATSTLSGEVVDPMEVTQEVWDEHLGVSLRGAFYLAQASFPHLRDAEGTFLFLTSPAGIEGSAELGPYATVKGAQRAMVKSLAREWGPHGVTVNSISPLARSDAMDEALENFAGLKERLEAIVPLGRVGECEEDIGPVAAFFCSQGARYVSGQNLQVSGGRFTLL